MPHILLIDDEPPLRGLMARLLTRDGYEVTCAGDGNEGLEAYRNHPSDMVITDIMMPVKNGLEFLTELRNEFPEAKVIAMSGGGILSAEDGLSRAAKLGAKRTLQKPFTHLQLSDAVREVLRS